MEDEEENNQIKVVFLGENKVGKTSLIQRYITGDFRDFGYTIGASYSEKNINCDEKNYFLHSYKQILPLLFWHSFFHLLLLFLHFHIYHSYFLQV